MPRPCDLFLSQGREATKAEFSQNRAASKVTQPLARLIDKRILRRLLLHGFEIDLDIGPRALNRRARQRNGSRQVRAHLGIGDGSQPVRDPGHFRRVLCHAQRHTRRLAQRGRYGNAAIADSFAALYAFMTRL